MCLEIQLELFAPKDHHREYQAMSHMVLINAIALPAMSRIRILTKLIIKNEIVLLLLFENEEIRIHVGKIRF